jgi:diaminohydroxyphosphoribosylaminopyrimidine deaminase/5-amino-6-(5-phosphoribosylamino)uracil reductase
VTGEAARAHVHRMRNRYHAIMVGVGTVLADDPMLTCRLGKTENGVNPVRIICDTVLRTPLESQIVRTAKEVPTIIASCNRQEAMHMPYVEAGCQILVTPEKDGQVDLWDLMRQLGEQEIDSVILEGGGTLNWSALQAGLVQKVQAYVAPKLFGGATAKTPVEGQGFLKPAEAVTLSRTKVTALGSDWLIEGYPATEGRPLSCLQES